MFAATRRLTHFAIYGLCLLLSACASNSIYRSQFSPCVVTAQNACDANSMQEHEAASKRDYFLSFVEIDDQGQLRDRRQLKALLDHLQKLSGTDDLLINVFVHGWHHNAKPGDENIEGFKQSLAQLSEIEHGLRSKPRKVVGVYVGWRGESIDLPALRYTTFWDRKNTAQKVGHLGMTELLLRLEEIRNVKNTMDQKQRNRLVVIGHSFGGAAVFSATSQILADRFIDSRADKSVVTTAKGFGDLVVLLNPAFEALSYAPLYDLAQSRCSYFPNQTPRLVILTSEADDATGKLFPIGRGVSNVFENYDTVERNACAWQLSYSESEADRAAVGHFVPLQSHELQPAKQVQNPVYQEIAQLWATQSAGATLQLGSTELKNLNKTALRNPYLNVKVSGSLIPDHNDIFHEEIKELVRILTVLSTNE